MPLEALPCELIESIVVRLNTRDIGNLRSTSHVMKTKATQDHFKSRFVKQRVTMTEEKMMSFAAMTKATDSLCCLVEELTIIGNVNNTLMLEKMIAKGSRAITQRQGVFTMSTEHRLDDAELAQARQNLEVLKQRYHEQHDMRQVGRDADLLVEVFNNIQANSGTRGLRLITLEVHVYEDDPTTAISPATGGNWRPIWKRAAETFQASVTALTQSRLRVAELDAFSELRRCAIPCNEIGKINLDDDGLSDVLHELTAFSISVSNPILNQRQDDRPELGIRNDPDGTPRNPLIPVIPPHDPEVLRAQASDEANFIGLAKFLSQCSKLEKLDLHFYILNTPGLQTNELHNEKLFHHITRTAAFPRLHSIRLRGLYLHAEDLLTFIQASPVRMLVLQNLYLQTGTWTPIFSHCTSSDMDFLFFDDLFQDGKLVYFGNEGDGKPKYPSLCGTQGKNTLLRKGKDEATREIKHHFATQRPYGSQECWMWRQAISREYGPPEGF